MGRITLPSISKVEEVLDLLLDPAKYQKYMVEFKATYDAAKLALDNLQTKEQADTYLSQSITAHQQAEKDKASAASLLAEAKRESEVLQANAVAYAAEVNMQHLNQQEVF